MTRTAGHGIDRIGEAAEAIRRAAGRAPRTAVVLGSGFGTGEALLADAVSIPYAALPHWPQTGVKGHPGTCTVGRAGDRPVVALAGRVHLYEGAGADAVVFATRVLGRLGVRALVLTCAAGGIRPDLAPGTLMVLDDHISLFVPNPLVGPNDDRAGPRFPDMTEVYSPRLRALADETAHAAGLPLAHGVYAAVTGPSYETPADIRALRALGADAVGASTVPEAIVARHEGIEVLGLACIANAAAGLATAPLHHDEVLRTVGAAHGQLRTLLQGILERL